MKARMIACAAVLALCAPVPTTAEDRDAAISSHIRQIKTARPAEREAHVEEVLALKPDRSHLPLVTPLLQDPDLNVRFAAKRISSAIQENDEPLPPGMDREWIDFMAGLVTGEQPEG